LHAALLARDLNPRIRIVLRQFNRTLAHKIEQNLSNLLVLSLAWPLGCDLCRGRNRSVCFRGLQFPEPDGPLTGFATRIVEDCGVEGDTVEHAAAGTGARIIAIDGATDFSMTRCSREEPNWSCMVKLSRCRLPHLFDRGLLREHRVMGEVGGTVDRNDPRPQYPLGVLDGIAFDPAIFDDPCSKPGQRAVGLRNCSPRKQDGSIAAAA